ncbi:MAG: hypothetical protein M3Y41_14955, partial [Pseudomonadota bacterium]|nr:hypothetical protein [Pseudomonadota bacterium]
MMNFKNYHHWDGSADFAMTPAWPTWLRHDRRPVTVVRIASFLLADIAAFLLALLISTAAIDLFPPQPGPSVTITEATVLLMAGVVACLASIGHYRRRLPLWMTLRNLVGVSGAALLGSCLVELLTGRHDSLALLLGPWILLPPLALFARSLVRQSLNAAGLWKVPVIVVGTSRVAQQAVAALRSEARLGYEAVAVINPSSAALSTGASRWAPMLGQHGAEMLVLALDPEGGPRGTEIQSLVRERIPFAVIPSLDGLPLFGCEPTAFIQHDTVLLSYTNNLAKPVARAAKLAFDWLAAAALI